MWLKSLDNSSSNCDDVIVSLLSERLLAAQNPLTQATMPHQLFADAPAPPTQPNMSMPPPPPPGMVHPSEYSACQMLDALGSRIIYRLQMC